MTGQDITVGGRRVLTTDQAAAVLGMRPKSFTRLVNRLGIEADDYIGRSPVYYPETVERMRARPGQGARTDLRDP